MYMLDTNMISFLIRDRGGELFRKFEKVSQKDKIVISSIVYAEVLYGVKKKNSPKLQSRVKSLLSLFDILPFDKKAGEVYADIRDNLSSRDITIGANDMLIASHAKSLDAILVTSNTKEFLRVNGLKIEDWSK